MPSFRTTVRLTVGGEAFEVRTNAGDQLTAERGIGENPMNFPVELGMRVWWSAFKRANPEHPAARHFRTFVEDLDAADEETPADVDGNGLDPTLPVATGG